jgi:hypothetical protein
MEERTFIIAFIIGLTSFLEPVLETSSTKSFAWSFSIEMLAGFELVEFS